MSYFVANLTDSQPKTYRVLKRLGDFRYASWVIEGSHHVAFKSHSDLRRNKVHAFYTVQDGILRRDKYRTAMHQIREMFS
jgi:hypothetical protein